MTCADATTGPSPWNAAAQAALLVAVDPAGLGGISIRSRSGPVRDRLLQILASCLPGTVAQRRVPLHISDERLLGGLDLAATLKAGRPLAERGLLAEAHGGIIILGSAERIAAATVARITAAIDRGAVDVARDGFSFASPARFGVVALDEGIEDDEGPSDALLDRLAFLVNLDGVSQSESVVPDVKREAVLAAREGLASVSLSEEICAALCNAAEAMGVDSTRASIFALRAARAAAALAGRDCVSDVDAALAAQLVLAPRATRMPPDELADDEDTDAADPPPEITAESNADDDQKPGDDQQLVDVLLDAAKAAIPAGLLAALKSQTGSRQRSRFAGKAGIKQKSVRHGRPAGVRRGELKSGARLNVVETLRAAAAWQPLRRQQASLRGDTHPADVAQPSLRRRIEVRKDDFRITRFKTHSETTTIFVVDASGSSALNRLAEAKGAVELLLADCYVRRDSVALIAFRGKTAELILPPTRSLVRAKRSLAGLPGGGGTPLAHAIDAAATLADAVRRKGQTPTIIVLTDGRANISRDGAPGRPKAEADGIEAARFLAFAGVKSLVIDTSPKPAVQSERLARAMAAVYLPLPYADAATLTKAVQAVSGSDHRVVAGQGIS